MVYFAKLSMTILNFVCGCVATFIFCPHLSSLKKKKKKTTKYLHI